MRANLLILAILVMSVHSQSCLATYQYSDPNTGACLPCPTSCSSCFDTQSCTACVPEYYLNNNLCSPCPFGCSVCSSASTCSLCIDGLYVNVDGQCVACANGVQSCTIAAIQTCKTGYFMLDTICAGCIDHCTTCQDFATCMLCDRGYFLATNSTSCLPCSANCAVCQDATTCTSCSQGFVLSGGSCIAPSCSSISPFCQKCSNGQCEQCQFGKYVNSNGTCSQGASLLCLSALGPYHTNCQTNLYGCPSYANVQTDSSNAQLPVCIPKLASQSSEYYYQSFRSFINPTQCNASSSASCSAPSSQLISVSLAKPYFHLQYTIALRIYSSATQNVLVSALQTGTNSSLGLVVHAVNITTQFSQSLSDPNCFNCPYGETIITGQMSGSGTTNSTIIQVDSSSSLVVVEEMLIKIDICKVQRCAACTTAIDCVLCNSPYYLQLITCVDACDPGFYKYNRACVLTCPSNTYPIQSSYECSPCISPCLTCSASNLCLSCVSGYFLEQSSCVLACSKPQLFTNITSQKCETCPNPCTQCAVTVTNSSNSSGWSVSCSGCGVGYLLQGGNCTYICPLGTFSNYISNKTQCSTCASGCAQCSISQTLCSSCQGSYLLSGNTCFMNFTCPLGYYTDLTRNSCEKCHYPCLTCSLTATNCTSCTKGALLNSTCPLDCPAGMFIDYSSSSQVCSACVSPCVHCINLNICLTCIAGNFLYNGNCWAQCPTLMLYKQMSNSTCLPCQPPCLQCQNSTYCLSCTTGYLDPITHTCTLECALAWYPDSNFTCQLCVSPCLRCFSNSSCSMCQLPYVLYNQACITVVQCSALNRYVHYHLNYSDVSLSNESAECAQCTYPCGSCSTSPILCSSCAPTYLLVPELSICLQTCPQSYFPNTTVSVPVCQKCNSQCLACSQIATNCTQCGTSMYLNTATGTCGQTCPSGYYGSNEDQMCKPCQPPCLECYNVYLCKSCVTGIFYNKACVSSCPDGSIHNTTANLCNACTNNCLSCSVSTSNCTECPTNGFYYFNNQCVTQCSTGYYADEMSHACQACIAPCLQCLSSTTCSTCVPNYFLIVSSAHCSTTCPDGLYADSTTLHCELCNTTICSTCVGQANNCTKCVPGYYFDTNLSVCTQTCPVGTYADTFYLQCRTCRFPCIICTASNCLQCDPVYKLYSGNCYSNCPIGYFATNSSTCSQCDPLCQICSNATACLKCVTNYFVNATLVCVPKCQIGYYGGADLLTSYALCYQCLPECVQCTQTFNCTSCQPGYFYFNGLCETECPALYFALNSSSGSTCSPCPQYCNKCTSSSTCLECLNSYIYNSQCFPACPMYTYTFNEQQCIDCVSPCLQCTSPYYCLSCSSDYLFFQNYCVQQCPQDVWKYPQTRQCKSQCPYNKYVAAMQCYVTGCGGMLVHLNGYCLEQCPADYYVDENQNCIPCSQNSAQCNNLLVGQLTILRTHNLKACLYFNQLVRVDLIDTSRIQVTFTDDSTTSIIQYDYSTVTLTESRLTIEFGYRQIQLQTILVKIPYIQSKTRSQSISYNQFKQNIDVYNNYQYESSYTKTSSTSSSSQSTNSNTNQINALYTPTKAMSIIGTVLVIGCYICLLINIVTKGAHYRQLLDFLQFVAVTLYLEIQYPPAMASFLQSIQISMFSFLPHLSMPLPYAFSSSKFIQYNGDSSLLRSQGVLFIIFASLFLIFMVLIMINKFRPDLLVRVIKRIKYRNVTDLFCITSLPLLLYVFSFKSSNIIDLVARIVVLVLITAFLGFMSYVLMTVKNLQQIAGLAGQLQATQSPLGHMYTPFAFLRKIIFALLINIQPQKPISSLTLLLIFTILIMVCLFFYQPFQNQITDYVSIFMQVMLILFVIVLMLFGLNVVKATSGHYMAIVGCAFVIIGAVGGLTWLGYLTIHQIKKFKDQKQPQTVKNQLQEGINSQNQPEDVKASQFDPVSGNKISSKDMKQSDQVNQNKQEEDQPSAANLMRDAHIKSPASYLKGKAQPKRISDLRQQQIGVGLSQSNQSEQNNEQFRHWNNDDSQNSSQHSKVKQSKAPRYLLKMQKNRNE